MSLGHAKRQTPARHGVEATDAGGDVLDASAPLDHGTEPPSPAGHRQ